MAVRQATLRYASIGAFLKAWEETLSQGAAYLAAGTVEGELAKEFKLDVVVPGFGAVGPFNAQVVHTTPDGGTGVRLIETPPSVTKKVDEILGLVEQIKSWLMETGQLVDPKTLPPPAAAPAAAPAAGAQPTVAAPVAPGQPAARPRGLLIPDVGSRDPDMAGDMADRSLRDGLVQLAVEKATGLLTIVEADGRRRFGFWSKGGPVGWRSEPMDKEEVLGVLLFRSGNLTKEQLAESIEMMNETGVRQGEALIEMGALNYGQLVMVLQKQVEFVLQRAMKVRDGVWGFHNLERLPQNFVNPPLKVPSMLYRALREHAKSMRLEELYKSQKPVLDRYVSLTPSLVPVLDEIKFKGVESKLLSVIQSTSWRLRELFSVSPMSRQDTATTIWALNELRCLGFGESEDLERYLARVSSRILGKAQNLLQCNHFDVLEVHWICLDEEVASAHRKLKEEFSPDRYHDLTPELTKALEVIDRALDKAHAAVREKGKRRAYREEIVETSMIVQSAELLGKKGEMAIMKKDYREANFCWSKAMELMPGRPEYRDGYQRAQALRRGF